MIRKITVKNFRSLKSVEIVLENDLTVLVGENDSGKSSVVEALKIMFENKKVENDDFHWNTDKICIEVETNDMSFIKEFSKNEDSGIQSEITVRFGRKFLKKTKQDINSNDFSSLSDEDKRKKLVNYANKLSLQFRSNIGTDTLKDRVLNKIDELLNSENAVIKGDIPNYNIYFLNGKDFEVISEFFQEIFFKEKSKSIWNEKVGEEITIEDIIRKKLNEYAENL